jgi:glycine/D-amino acid oxidase-like deaminating enzyme
MTDRPRVIVVGAGIIGASIAWHLAQAGARVTVLDAEEPGGVATRRSWAWINASHGNPEPYFRLRLRAMQDWRRLAAEVPEIRVAWCGGLFWQVPPDALESFAAEHAAWGYELRRLGRDEIARLEPYLRAPPDRAIHVPGEGVVEPLPTAQALLSAAARLGAVVTGHRRVLALLRVGGRVTGVETDVGPLAADEVVIAGGVGSASLLATAGIDLPMRASPALVVATTAHAPTLRGLLITPMMELRQTAEGRLLAVGHLDDAQADCDVAEPAAALLEEMRGLIDTGTALVPDLQVIAHRSIPGDGFPAIGRSADRPGLYTAVTHSGITLAPIIGRFAAAEILTGERDALLAPYGMARFT